MEPVRVICDTREQLPYVFSDRVVAVRRALPAGDYSVEGLEHLVAIERKALDDFVSCVIHERERFHRLLHKLQAIELACVVVEANLADIFAHCYYSKAHPASVAGAAIAIIVDHAVPVIFGSDRETCCRFTEGLLLRASRKLRS